MSMFTNATELAKKALHMVRINLPYLAELTDNIELIETEQVNTAGIFASGRLVFNPGWLLKRSLQEATFVMAHEIMHLALRSHERSETSNHHLFNITHDYIINEMLKEALEMSVPANGLDWAEDYGSYFKIENKSAEELMLFISDALQQNHLKRDIFRDAWLDNVYRGTLIAEMGNYNLPGPLRHQIQSDVLSDALELELFPFIKPSILRKQHMEELSRNFYSHKLIFEKARDMFGNHSGSYKSAYEALKTQYQPPWEAALQQWLEFTTRAGRTYARASRREAAGDYVLAGHKREGHTIHIVIDTSGSMAHELGRILGIIASFAESLMTPEIHIIQCDTGVSDDNWYAPAELNKFVIKGLGGSDMTPGMYRLAEDPEVQSAIVITDGYIQYPAEPMPYETLWVITGFNTSFNPGYGKVIQAKPEL